MNDLGEKIYRIGVWMFYALATWTAILMALTRTDIGRLEDKIDALTAKTDGMGACHEEWLDDPDHIVWDCAITVKDWAERQAVK